jgi:5S rRNA maturation endonuclease (ribonuclease M5)
MTPEELERFCKKELGMRQMHLGNNGWFRACCPIHDEHNPSFGIFGGADYHPYLCFVCGKGSLLGLTMKVRSVGSTEAMRLIHQYGTYAEITASDFPVLPEWDALVEARRGSKPESLSWNGMSGWPLHAAYEGKKISLIRMHVKVSERLLRKCRIGFDNAKKRIVYPWAWNGQLIGLTGRTVKTDPLVPKTLPYFGFQKGGVVYSPFGKIDSSEPVVLVEGEKSALRVARVFPNVVASGFAYLTQAQARLISENCSACIVFPDPDKGGQNLFRSAVAQLFDKVKLYHAGSIEGLDPADMKGAQVIECLNPDNIKMVLTKTGELC